METRPTPVADAHDARHRTVDPSVDTLEGVVTCIGYGDYLRHTLPHNREHFDRLCVVTTPCDDETQDVCARYGVDVRVSSRVHHDHAPFNKGCAINDGQATLRADGWVLLLDADIVLPPAFRSRLREQALDRRHLYGATRRMCASFAAWMQHQASGAQGFDSFPPHRIVTRPDGGYLPSGYFQLFHCSAPALADRREWYSEAWRWADKSDMWFASRWEPAVRTLLSGLDVLHLDEGGHVGGVNWWGRMSPPFERPA